jgi:hypothetical protein
MTPKNKKTLLICAGVLIASYFIHSAVTYSMQMAYQQAYQQRMALAQKGRTGVTGQSSANEGAVGSSANSFAGKWTGMFVSNLGGCTIQLELVEPKPGHYTGYPEFSCSGTAAQAAKSPFGPYASILNTESVIMSGQLQKDREIEAVHFHIEKNAGTDMDGCALTSFTITPSASNTLIAEWEKGTCPAGHTLLRKQRQSM